MESARDNSFTFSKLIDFLKGKKVYVQTHNYPDPDAIGSGFGFQKLLEHFGIDATLCYYGKIDRVNTRKMIEMLDIDIVSKDDIEDHMMEHDPIVCIDSQKYGGNIIDLKGDEVACIDHHPTVEIIDYYYKDIRMVGSCATIIAGYYEQMNIRPSVNVATALLYGLQMDTNGFTRGVTDADIHAFGFLHPFIDQKILSSLEQNLMEFKDLQAYGAAISNIQIFDNIGFAFIPFSCQDALIAITCDFILSLEEVYVAIVYSKRDTGYKFSVRSEENVSDIDCGVMVSEALIDIGTGGGHSFMAGGFVPIENINKLGNNPDEALIQKFMQVKERMTSH
ncbi:MAG: DHH family phosphoesterase [Lachnospiraceae bacterium]|nr:DHH family phosphoesterase [Lachnospiraceae bacterium]